MSDRPQVESPNTLTIDYADNPDLKEIFIRKDAGAKVKLTMELQVMAKDQETVTLAIDKIVTEPGDYEKNEAEPTLKEPIMATMKRRRSRSGGMMGPHNRPPQEVENSAEPWMKSYA